MTGITYVPTAAGFFKLPVVLDALSRRIVGYRSPVVYEQETRRDTLAELLFTRAP